MECTLIEQFNHNSTLILPNYLCSSLSYKEYFKVDPIRLSLVKAGFNHDSSINPLELIECLSKFNEASLYLSQSSKITSNTIKVVNSIITGNKIGFRNGDCWLGEPNLNTHYRCPPAKRIKLLIKELINFILSKSLDIDDIIYIYFKLISIHPFKDGNGRSSRVLFYWLTRGKVNSFLCPYLYHTQDSHSGYVELVRLAHNNKTKFYRSSLLKSFKQKASIRIDYLKRKHTKLAHNLINNLGRDGLSLKIASVIYQKLFQSPVLNLKDVVEDCEIKRIVSSNILNDLVSKKIFKIKRSQNGEVYIFSKDINTFIRSYHLLSITGNE
jgi:hypothetical protein